VSYRLDGTYFEHCNCDVACPCSTSNLLLPATNERCYLFLVFHVDSGEIDGIDVGGKTAALFVDAPGQMTEGAWKVGLLVDDDTSDDQRAALVSVFAGEQGGPASMFSPLVGELLGVEYAPMEYESDGTRHGVRVGEGVDVEVEDFAGAVEGSVMTVTGAAHPVGSTITLARATRSRIAAFGYDLALDGKNGHAAPFSWDV
jgi:hypothetical protein